EHNEQESLQQWPARIICRVAHLPQRAEQPAGHENEGKQQDSFVQPARHAAPQAGRGQLQLLRPAPSGADRCGNKVLWSTWPGSAEMRGASLAAGLGFGIVASFSGGTGLRAAAVAGGLGALAASLCFSSAGRA